MSHKKLITLSFFILFLIQSAYPEEKKPFKPRFSVKLTGGLGYVAAGDINKVLGSVNDSFKDARENNQQSVVGEIRKLNSWTPDWEAELRMDLSARFGVGIATSGAFERNGESSLTFTYYNYTDSGLAKPWAHTLTYKSDIKASMPIRLNFYYCLNRGARRSIVLSAGIGYYSGKMSATRNFEVIRATVGDYSEKTDWEVRRQSAIAFHGGADVEYSLSKRLDLVMEMRGRFVRITPFKGTMAYENNWGEKYISVGTLYYFNMWSGWTPGSYSRLEVWDKQSEFFRDIYDIRKARLDLSGFSLRIGVRLKIF